MNLMCTGYKRACSQAARVMVAGRIFCKECEALYDADNGKVTYCDCGGYLSEIGTNGCICKVPNA